MEPRYKIIALNLDSLLSFGSKGLSPSTVSSLIDVQRHGVHLALVSSRPTIALSGFVRELRLSEYHGYILSYYGAKITSCREGAILARNTIEPSYLSLLATIAKEQGASFVIYTKDSLVSDDPENEALLDLARSNGDLRVVSLDDYPPLSLRPSFMCSVLGDESQLFRVRTEVEKRFSGALRCLQEEGSDRLDILSESVDKGEAVSFLLRDLDFSSSQLIALGDTLSDLRMLQGAGLGVVTAQASEALKQCADYVTKSFEEEGIVHMINKYLYSPAEQHPDLALLNSMVRNTLMDSLGIVCTHLEAGRVEATMPVDVRTRQPMGILHGGASLALAETIAGYGSLFLLQEDEIQVGMQVSGNHISSAHEGEIVRALATMVHKGRSTHVWNVDITTENGKLVSTVRVVNSILRKR